MLAATLAFTLTFYSMACLGMGMIIWVTFLDKGKNPRSVSAGTQLATNFILGQGVLASLWLLLALAGWFSHVVVFGTVTLLALIGVILVRQLLTDLWPQLKSIWSDLYTESWGWKLTALLTISLCLATITALGRHLSVDASSFYLALPKVIAETYLLRPLPGVLDNFAILGLQGEMHSAALMSISSPDAARLFEWLTLLAGAVMLLALGRQIGLQRRGQWLLLSMLYTSSAVILLGGFGKTDLYALAFGLAAFYWVVQCWQESSRPALWMVGLFSGFAIVAKISYIPAIFPGIGLLSIWAYVTNSQTDNLFHKGSLTNILRWIQPIITGLVFAVLPHVIKNSLLFNNPIAPLGSSSPVWLDFAWYGPNTIRHIILTYPLAVTFGNYYAQLGNVSPLVLAFLPLSILLPRSRPLWKSPLFLILLAALIGITAWTIARPSRFAPRFILPNLLLFTLPAAKGAEFVSQNDNGFHSLTTTVISATGITLISAGLIFNNTAFFPLKTYRFLSGNLSECARENIFCEPMVQINQQAPLGTRIFINLHQRYWLRSDLIQCLLTYDEVRAYTDLQTDEARWSFIYKQGFRYIIELHNPEGLPNIPVPSLENTPEWLSVNRAQLGYNSIMSLRSRDSSHEVDVVCRQEGIRLWSLETPYFNP